jgi:hypothetical protein
LGNKAITEDDVIDLEKDIRFDNETNITGRLKIDMPAGFPEYLPSGGADAIRG